MRNLIDDTRTVENLVQLEHRIDVAVVPDAVFDVLADVGRWPQILPATVHAERVATEGRRERIRIVATAGETVKSWESLRVIDADTRSIAFRQIQFQRPIGHMEGRWEVRDNGAGGSTVVLGHRFAANDSGRRAWLHDVVDENSRVELDALRTALETAPAGDDPRLIDFADSVVIAGPPSAVFAFIDEAERWSERLPHVVEVDFARLDDGVQDLAMTTCSPDGSTHRTRSYRVVLDDGSIVYKQFTLPPLMASHTGRWSFRADGTRTVATSAHTVVVDADRITEALGPEADLATAREKVRAALTANSLATLGLARTHVEGPDR
jgi:aromatase